jgi:ABC-type transport system substrate-binding protein
MKGKLFVLITCFWLLSSSAFAQRTFGTLVVVEAGALPAGPSPLSAESPAEWRFVELCYAPLFAIDPNDKATPYLAESAKVLDGGKQLLVTLRADALWHDGRAVSPLDVIYTYRLAMAGKWNKAWVDLLRPLTGVRRSDDGFDLVLNLNGLFKTRKGC